MKIPGFRIMLILLLPICWGCNYLDYSEADDYRKEQVFAEIT